jgi:hypothetical protein
VRCAVRCNGDSSKQRGDDVRAERLAGVLAGLLV